MTDVARQRFARGQVSVWRRYMELPRYLRSVQGRVQLAAALTEISEQLGFSGICLISGSTVTAQVADELTDELEPLVVSRLRVGDNSEAEVARLASVEELRGADAVAAVGGGKTIDVAKSVCDAVDLPVIAVPTQLTADGIASPVSVLRQRSGEFESRRARLPIGLVCDLDVVARAPVASIRAGIGDLLANSCALRDWGLAASAGLEVVDDFAALLSRTAFDLVHATDVASLGAGEATGDLLHRLLQGLVLSGLAMELAGSSRPCSGSEHLVSHALDRLHPSTAHHGEQVAFGALVCTCLQRFDWRRLRNFMLEAGMEWAACGFDLGEDALVQVVQSAPATRPERYTALDEAELSDGAIRPIVREVLSG